MEWKDTNDHPQRSSSLWWKIFHPTLEKALYRTIHSLFSIWCQRKCHCTSAMDYRHVIYYYLALRRKACSWGRYGLFSRFDLSFKEGVIREIFLQRCSLHSSFSRSLVFTVLCYNGPIECLFKTSLFIICCGLDRWNATLVWMNGFYNQVSRIRFWSLIQKCL